MKELELEQMTDEQLAQEYQTAKDRIIEVCERAQLIGLEIMKRERPIKECE
jgi:hypothetical protein